MAIQPTDTFSEVMNSLANAIHEKNSDATLPMTLAQMIAGVEGISDSGLPTGIKEMRYGTYQATTTQTYSDITITYDEMENKPDIAFIVFRENSTYAGASAIWASFAQRRIDSNTIRGGCFYYTTSVGALFASGSTYEPTTSKWTARGSMTSDAPWYIKYTYYWFILALE